jgi:hypothetical protein
VNEINEDQYPRAGCVHIGANYRWLTLAGSEGYQGLVMRTAFAKFAAEETADGRQVDDRDKREFFRGWRAGKAQYALRNMGNLMRYLDANELDEIGDDLMTVAIKWGAVKAPKGSP